MVHIADQHALENVCFVNLDIILSSGDSEIIKMFAKTKIPANNVPNTYLNGFSLSKHLIMNKLSHFVPNILQTLLDLEFAYSLRNMISEVMYDHFIDIIIHNKSFIW